MQGNEAHGWPVYSNDNIVSLTDEFQTFTDTFTMEADTDKEAFLSICLGNVTEEIKDQHTVVIDDITLEDLSASEGDDSSDNDGSITEDVSNPSDDNKDDSDNTIDKPNNGNSNSNKPSKPNNSNNGKGSANKSGKEKASDNNSVTDNGSVKKTHSKKNVSATVANTYSESNDSVVEDSVAVSPTLKDEVKKEEKETTSEQDSEISYKKIGDSDVPKNEGNSGSSNWILWISLLAAGVVLVGGCTAFVVAKVKK